jgi:hypothetical protein
MPPAHRFSLLANGLLAATVGFLLWREPPAATEIPGIPAVRTAEVAGGPDQPAAESSLRRPQASAGLGPAVLSQLEELGLTRDVVVTALLENFHRRWDREFIALENRYAPRPVPEREYIELARRRDAEQLRELKTALGEDGYRQWDRDRTLRLLNVTGVTMTSAESDQAYRLQKEFEETHRELQMAMEDGIVDPADGSILQAQAQEALDRELATLLGAQRLAELRGVSDPTAEVYRRFGDVQPTAAQAHAILQAEADYTAREAALARRWQEKAADARALVTEMQALAESREENLRRILGAEAYNTQKRLNDPTFRTLQQYAQAWQLDGHEVDSVYATLQSYHEKAERARTAAAMAEAAGHRIDWQEVHAAIDQARQQTEAGLHGLIGAERLRRLTQNGLLGHR